MKKNKFLAILAVVTCLATVIPIGVFASTPGQVATPPIYKEVPEDYVADIATLFDANYYRENHDDLVAAGITTDEALFSHFLKYGIFEGRACSAEFNVSAYKSAYGDLRDAFGDDIVMYYVHYARFGKNEERTLCTVDAVTAAGIDVVSAVDAAAVASAKKVVSYSDVTDEAVSNNNNGSGSGTSNGNPDASGNDFNSDSNATAANKSAVNTAIPQITVLTKNPVEAILNTNIDISYEFGHLYDYSSPQIAKSKTNELLWNYCYANGAYHQLVSYDQAKDDKFVKATESCNKGQWAGKEEWYDSTKSVEKDTATKSGYDPDQWYTVNDIQYYKRDLYNDAYRTTVSDASLSHEPDSVSGCGWRLKAGYGVVENGDEAIFFKTSGNRNGVKSEIKPETRIMDGFYVYTRRQSLCNDLANGKTRDGVKVYFDPATVRYTRDEAELAGYFEVSNVDEDKYILQRGNLLDIPGTIYGLTLPANKVLSYEIVSVHEACTPDVEHYGILKDANGNVTGAYNLTVEGLNTEETWYCKPGYVYGTDGKYHEAQPDKSKRVAQGYTYYGTKSYRTAITDQSSISYGMYFDVDWEDACYIDTPAYEEEATGKVPVAPDETKYVFDKATYRYYPIVDNLAKAFRPYEEGEEVAVGQFTDKRYYYTND